MKNPCWKRSFIIGVKKFSKGEEKKSRQVIVKPKVFFSSKPSSQKSILFVLLSSSGGKIFYFTTCIVDGDDENKVNQSLIFFFHFWFQLFLQRRMTSWDWSLRRLHWKLFKWSFHSRRWSGRCCCISNLENCVDQKNHLDKDALKKYLLWSRDVRWPASIFFRFLSRHPRSWFLDQVQISTSPKYFRFPELLYSTYIICMVVLVPDRM